MSFYKGQPQSALGAPGGFVSMPGGGFAMASSQGGLGIMAGAPLPQPKVSKDLILEPKTAKSVKLFVGQIPRVLTEQELLPILSEFGTVCEISLIRDRATGSSRGCAFVTMATKADAEHLINALNNVKTITPVRFDYENTHWSSRFCR
jgi:RNA recognition motif-containing protein